MVLQACLECSGIKGKCNNQFPFLAICLLCTLLLFLLVYQQFPSRSVSCSVNVPADWFKPEGGKVPDIRERKRSDKTEQTKKWGKAEKGWATQGGGVSASHVSAIPANLEALALPPSGLLELAYINTRTFTHAKIYWIPANNLN